MSKKELTSYFKLAIRLSKIGRCPIVGKGYYVQSLEYTETNSPLSWLLLKWCVNLLGNLKWHLHLMQSASIIIASTVSFFFFISFITSCRNRYMAPSLNCYLLRTGNVDEILSYLASYRYHFTCGSRAFKQFLLWLLSFLISGMKIFQLMKMCCYSNVLQCWPIHLKNINTKF